MLLCNGVVVAQLVLMYLIIDYSFRNEHLTRSDRAAPTTIGVENVVWSANVRSVCEEDEFGQLAEETLVKPLNVVV